MRACRCLQSLRSSHVFASVLQEMVIKNEAKRAKKEARLAKRAAKKEAENTTSASVTSRMFAKNESRSVFRSALPTAPGLPPPFFGFSPRFAFRSLRFAIISLYFLTAASDGRGTGDGVPAA